VFIRRLSLLLLSLAACAGTRPAPRAASPRQRAEEPPKVHARSGRYWLFVDNITHEPASASQPSSGAPAERAGQTPRAIRLWVALPLDRPGQKVKLGSITPAPTELLRDADTGNRVVYWEVKDPPASGSLVFHYDFEVDNHAVLNHIDPDRVRRLPDGDPRLRRFTRSAPWVEVTPEIAARAREIVGSETNPYRQARLVFDWVVQNVTYDYPDVKSRGVKQAFARLRGDCGEFTHIFIAMMRALGVPARSVVAVWYQGGGHAWAEILLEPHGWVPVDTSGAQLVKNGLKGQMKPKQVRSFMKTRGIPTRDPRWLLGNLYPHRLEVFVGDHIAFRAARPGGTRTFHFLQPGGRAGWPMPYELVGLSNKTVLAGFYRFGPSARDEQAARAQALEELAPALLAAGLHERAVPGLQQRVRRKPADATALFQLGQACFNLKRYQEAIALLQRALDGKGGSTKPTLDVWALIIKGMCHDALGQREAALTCYRRAVKSGVDFAGAQKTARALIDKPFAPDKAKQGALDRAPASQSAH